MADEFETYRLIIFFQTSKSGRSAASINYTMEQSQGRDSKADKTRRVDITGGMPEFL